MSPESLSSSKSGAGSPSRTKRASSRRAVGIVRVSRTGGREGERFVSPTDQRLGQREGVRDQRASVPSPAICHEREHGGDQADSEYKECKRVMHR